MKLKLKLSHVRIVVQLLALIFLTQLFTLGFMGFRKVYDFLIGKGAFDLNSPSVITAVLLVIGAILLGRFFCGWLCAFGTINDLLHGVFTALTKKKLKIPPKLDAILVYLKYAVLLAIVILIWTFNISFLNGLSPWHSFASLLSNPFNTLTQPAGLVVLIAVLGAGVVYERFFCRYLCPLGAIQSLLSLFRISRLSRKETLCNYCGKCSRACPMGNEITTGKKICSKKVKSAECISCYQCAGSCNTESLSIMSFGKAVPGLVAALAGVLLFACSDFFISISNSSGVSAAISLNDKKTEGNKQADSEKKENKLYKDGVYIEKSFGYHPNMNVQVTFKNDKIVDIKILSHWETKGYYEEAFKSIPQQIISNQSTDYTSSGPIDLVTGATVSSKGICIGVDRAIYDAQEALQNEKDDEKKMDENKDK